VAALRDADGAAVKPGRIARLVRGVASVVGRPAVWIGGAAGALARRNAMRNPGRTAGTAAALMIGVALVTAVTVVAKGLDGSSRGSLADRVHASAVISGSDGWSPIDPKVEAAAAGAPGVKATTSIRQDGALVLGAQETVNAVDPATISRLFGDGALAKAGDGAVVGDDYATKHRLKVGDTLTLTSLKGTKLPLTIRAIEDTPSVDVLSLGPITVANATYDRAFEQQRVRMTLVDGPVDSVERAIAAFPDAKVETKDGFIDSQTAWIGAILAILWVLLALAVIVSLFGIVNTLVLSTFERMRELGTLRALGMHRRQVRRMVRHESIITALMGAGLGVLLGLGLAAIVTTAFSDEGLTFAVPVGSLIAFGVVAVIAGVIAAILPARRAARLNVLAALAWE
jgi:putative ABC transport system permease protein